MGIILGLILVVLLLWCAIGIASALFALLPQWFFTGIAVIVGIGVVCLVLMGAAYLLNEMWKGICVDLKSFSLFLKRVCTDRETQKTILRGGLTILMLGAVFIITVLALGAAITLYNK